LNKFILFFKQSEELQNEMEKDYDIG